jgi:diguanylate cyclase (GGDEF)-like protein/PAS domain S-box-containing protein
MRAGAASITTHRQLPWLREYGYAVRLTSCFLSVALAAGVICSTSATSLIWIANGVLLAYLLLASRRHWPAYFATGYAAQFVGSALAGIHWRIALLLSALNLLEVLIAALLIRKRSTTPPRFTDRTYLIRFTICGILAAPLAVSLMVAILYALWPNLALGATPQEWITADCLGIGIATPVCVAILRGNFRITHQLKLHWIYLSLLAAVTLVAFSQSRLPLLFFVYPLLTLILIRMGMGWAAISTLFVAVTGSWFTLHGQGPFALSRTFAQIDPILSLQVFIGSGVFLLYCISVVLERQHESVRELEKIAAIHALVTENSRDVIIIADFNGHRKYVSSAALTMGGWNPEELVNQGSLELLHEDDKTMATDVLRNLRIDGKDATIECRVRNRDGEYFWIESNLRLMRDHETGHPSGILNVVRDISERKKTEQRLQEAYSAVEALAITDALTGLANRRHFDQYLAAEWRRSMRDRQPISLLMLDADKFKAYNDTYGHQRGDNCLKQIAEACMDVVSRPGDLVARFGGEEFVVVLPNTENEGAMHVGNEICEALRSRRLPHSGNLPGVVTISAGCATLIPGFGKHAPELIEMADKALYKAKNNGRDQVCNGNMSEESETVKK